MLLHRFKLHLDLFLFNLFTATKAVIDKSENKRVFYPPLTKDPRVWHALQSSRANALPVYCILRFGRQWGVKIHPCIQDRHLLLLCSLLQASSHSYTLKIVLKWD